MLYRLYCDVLPLAFNKMSCTDTVQPENMIYTVVNKGELEKSKFSDMDVDRRHLRHKFCR